MAQLYLYIRYRRRIMHYVSKVWSCLKIGTIYNNLINSFAIGEQSLECYIKIFLIYSFNVGKRGNFALQSEWEIVNSLLAAAKWGNQTLGRIYSPRSTLFSISMHSSYLLLALFRKKRNAMEELSSVFSFLPNVFIQVLFRYVFIISWF